MNKGIEIKPETFQVESLIPAFGQANISSPLKGSFQTENFIDDGKDRILVDISLEGLLKASRPDNGKILFQPPTFELAGPREKIFWNPENLKVAIVTCGGLAPGLNNVIQNLVTFLFAYMQPCSIQNFYGGFVT